jgi:hypothetical protein
MSNQIESAIKTGRGYWFVDGFTEILGGLLFILLGAALAASSLPGQVALVSQFANLVWEIGLIKIFGLLAAGLLIWWLKERFTYPRTGFVRGKRLTPGQILRFLRSAALGSLLPLILLAAAIILLPALHGWMDSLPVWSPVLIGAIWALLCLLAGRWLGLRRFELLAALILLGGLAIGAFQLRAGLAVGLLELSFSRAFFGLGLLAVISGKFFLISGLVTFLRYRHANRQPSQEAV